MLINVYWRKREMRQLCFFCWLSLFQLKKMNGHWQTIELSTAIKLKLIYIYFGSVVYVRHVAALPMEILLRRTAIYRYFAREHVLLHRVRYRNKCCLYFEWVRIVLDSMHRQVVDGHLNQALIRFECRSCRHRHCRLYRSLYCHHRLHHRLQMHFLLNHFRTKFHHRQSHPVSCRHRLHQSPHGHLDYHFHRCHLYFPLNRACFDFPGLYRLHFHYYRNRNRCHHRLCHRNFPCHRHFHRPKLDTKCRTRLVMALAANAFQRQLFLAQHDILCEDRRCIVWFAALLCHPNTKKSHAWCHRDQCFRYDVDLAHSKWTCTVVLVLVRMRCVHAPLELFCTAVLHNEHSAMHRAPNSTLRNLDWRWPHIAPNASRPHHRWTSTLHPLYQLCQPLRVANTQECENWMHNLDRRMPFGVPLFAARLLQNKCFEKTFCDWKNMYWHWSCVRSNEIKVHTPLFNLFAALLRDEPRGAPRDGNLDLILENKNIKIYVQLTELMEIGSMTSHQIPTNDLHERSFFPFNLVLFLARTRETKNQCHSSLVSRLNSRPTKWPSDF